MEIITSRKQLAELAAELGVRPDWHEPDEQEVDAVVRGNDFDNAGFWPEPMVVPGAGGLPTFRVLEKHVVIKKGGRPVAAVNLATLLAFATGYEGQSR